MKKYVIQLQIITRGGGLFMKKLHSKFFAVVLSLIFVLSNFSFTSYASEVTEEEYLTPYIAMFEQYVTQSGVDAQIGDIDLFYETCKDFSLSEWKNRLDEIFEVFKSISKNDKPIVLQRDNNTQNRFYDSGFNGDNIKPFSSMFYDTFTGYIYSGYKYKITVAGTIVFESVSNVFNSVNWQSWNFPGENYFHVIEFRNTINNGDTASTDAAGVLKTAEGITFPTLITLSYKIYARNYNG